MDCRYTADIDRFITEHEASIIRNIGRLVAVNSVEGTAEADAPYGKGPARALELGLQIAGELGLETVNCENRIGYASVGDGEQYLATITHLDVVPVGEGWTGDPFALRERDGYLIGRGVMDNKGPSVICLYALKYLKDRKIPLKYSVRALLGINEETGMDDVDFYLKNYEAPVFCFSPDAGFPVCNGEKGICRGRILSRLPLGRVIDIRGGIAVNVIPGKAEAWVKGGCPQPSAKVSVEAEGELWHLTACGIGGHASKPEGTDNAIGILLQYILDNELADASEEKFFRALMKFFKSTDGSIIGIAADDGLFAPLTLAGSVIGVDDGHIFQLFDCRYPTNSDAEKIRSGIAAAVKDLAETVVDYDAVPFYISADNPGVKCCLDVYGNVTGCAEKPYTMGGATYAREFPNAVSFGPEHPERPHPDFAGPIHGADEAASLEELKEALKIYILTLLELEKTEF